MWEHGKRTHCNGYRIGTLHAMSAKVHCGHMQCKRHVRFAPNSDRESGFPHKVMSALSPKADMCSALAHVCFGPKADSCTAATIRLTHRRGRAVSAG